MLLKIQIPAGFSLRPRFVCEYILIFPCTETVWREAEKDYDCNILKSNLFAWPETSNLHNCFLPKMLSLILSWQGGTRGSSFPQVQAWRECVRPTVSRPAGDRMAPERAPAAEVSSSELLVCLWGINLQSHVLHQKRNMLVREPRVWEGPCLPLRCLPQPLASDVGRPGASASWLLAPAQVSPGSIKYTFLGLLLPFPKLRCLRIPVINSLQRTNNHSFFLMVLITTGDILPE